MLEIPKIRVLYACAYEGRNPITERLMAENDLDVKLVTTGSEIAMELLNSPLKFDILIVNECIHPGGCIRPERMDVGTTDENGMVRPSTVYYWLRGGEKWDIPVILLNDQHKPEDETIQHAPDHMLTITLIGETALEEVITSLEEFFPTRFTRREST